MNVNEQLQPHVKFGLPSSPIQKGKNEKASKIFGSETLFQGVFFHLFIEAGFVSHCKHIEKGTFLYSDMTTPSIP